MGKRAAEPRQKHSKKFKKEPITQVEPESPDYSSDSDHSIPSDAELDSSNDELESSNELDSSDDELDGSNNKDEALDDTKTAEGDQDAAYAQSQKAAARKQAKAERAQRKLEKPLGQEIAEAKKVWEEFRQKSIKTADRKRLVAQCYELTKEHTKDLVLRHDSSRIVQSIFKYADQKTRAEITTALKGTYVALAKSSYGKYLLVKMMHYGSAATRQSILDELHGSFRKLMGHREGAYVVEDAYREYSTAAQRRQMLREFYGSQFAVFKDKGASAQNLAEIIKEQPEKASMLLENLNEVITAAVNKGSIGFEIIHAAMLEYIRNIPKEGPERETFVDLVSEQISEMVHTKDGSQVASLVFALATAKERKKLLKALRPFGDKLASDQYGNLVMMAIFRTVDDTVLVSKTFIPPLQDQFGPLVTSKFGRRPWLYLMLGLSKKYFVGDISQRFAEIDVFKKKSSKKEDDVRNQELVAQFSPVIYTCIAENAYDLVRDSVGMQFVAEALEHGSRECAEWQPALNATVEAFEGSPEDEEHPINTSPFAGRALKALVKGVPEACEALGEVVAAHDVAWAAGNGSFVVVALLETLEDKALHKQLRKQKSAIAKAEPRGADILLKLLA